MQESDPAELVRRCIDGDDTARAEFISVYGELIRRVARQTLRTRGEMDGLLEPTDIEHNVYVKLFRNDCRAMRSLENPQSLKAWLGILTRNQTLTQLRGSGRLRQREQAMSIDAQGFSTRPDEEVEHREELALLRQEMKNLAPNDRIVLELFYLYNCSYAEIASIMRLNTNTVASRLSRAKSKLRDLLRRKRT